MSAPHRTTIVLTVMLLAACTDETPRKWQPEYANGEIVYTKITGARGMVVESGCTGRGMILFCLPRDQHGYRVRLESGKTEVFLAVELDRR